MSGLAPSWSSTKNRRILTGRRQGPNSAKKNLTSAFGEMTIKEENKLTDPGDNSQPDTFSFNNLLFTDQKSELKENSSIHNFKSMSELPDQAETSQSNQTNTGGKVPKPPHPIPWYKRLAFRTGKPVKRRSPQEIDEEHQPTSSPSKEKKRRVIVLSKKPNTSSD